MSIQPWAELSRDSSLLHILSTGMAQLGLEDLPLRRPTRKGGRWVLPVPWGSARTQSHSLVPSHTGSAKRHLYKQLRLPHAMAAGF